MNRSKWIIQCLKVLLIGLAAQNVASAVQVETAFTPVTRYDAAGRVLGTIAPNPDGAGALKYLATRNTYDSTGIGLLIRTEMGELSAWLNETVLPANWGTSATFTVTVIKEYSYDTYGRKILERVCAGAAGDCTTAGAIRSLIQYSYGPDNLMLCKALRMNPAAFATPPADACALGPEGPQGPDRISQYTYDAFGQVLTEIRALGVQGLQQTYVTNTYDQHLLRTQIDANGNKTELRYNVTSDYRLARRVYPSPTTAGAVNELDYNEYTYDLNGNVLTERKRSTALITNTYDADDRLVIKALSDHTYSGDVYFDYDLRGLQLAARFGSTTGAGITTSYDGFGHALTSNNNTDGVSRTLSYTYDADGDRTRLTYPDGVSESFGYDGMDRQVAICEGSATCTSATSPIITVAYNSQGLRASLSRGAAVASTTYTYDDALRLQAISHNLDGAVTTNDVTFGLAAYNSASQLLSQTVSNNNYLYAPSPASALYGVNRLNQYTNLFYSSSQEAPTYDLNGNMTAYAGASYSYDLENRLTKITATSGTTPMQYDPNGRLVQVGTGASATHFLYDGDALVGEYNDGGALQARYVHGSGVDELNRPGFPGDSNMREDGVYGNSKAVFGGSAGAGCPAGA
jgi:YD repeat-containing protein